MDKQELRQDPIRERILSSLSYVENNKNLLGGFVVAILVVMFAGGYYSSTTKALNVDTSVRFGKAFNSAIDGNTPDMSVFSDVINNGSANGATNAWLYMIHYNLQKDDSFVVDSLMALDMVIDDSYLSAKLLTLKGDRAFDQMEYDSALDYYEKASLIDITMKNILKLKQVSVYIEMGNSDEAMNIVDELLENDDMPFDIKNSCNLYKAMIENKS